MLFMLVTEAVFHPLTSSDVREGQLENMLEQLPLRLRPLISTFTRLYWLPQLRPVPDGNFPTMSMMPWLPE